MYFKYSVFAESHNSHLNGVAEETLNDLLKATVDIENMFASLTREQDEDTKKVYCYLFKVFINNSISTLFYITNCFSF